MAGFSESEEYTLRMDHEVYVTMTYIGCYGVHRSRVALTIG